MKLKGYAFISEILGTVRLADGGAWSPFVQGDWFQLAKTGTFFSPVYGKISISPEDLATMYRNFKTKTPLAPTRIPCDYDHLSDEPQKPEDGKAAGWIEDLEIRDGGQTLWAKPEWTKRAAELIANGEYMFVSPYFLTDYLDKASGKKIGPTLKAVAITNRPFLEGMQPIPAPAVAASDRRHGPAPVLSMLVSGGSKPPILFEGGSLTVPLAKHTRGLASRQHGEIRAMSELAMSRRGGK